MKKLYIGRIKLSKKDSEEWYGSPPFIYVTPKGRRTNLTTEAFFENKEDCVTNLKYSFKTHEHSSYGSKMELLEMSINIDKLTEI
jgi:hypothetical protein